MKRFGSSFFFINLIIIIIGDDKNHLSEAESLQDDLSKIGMDSIIDDRNESPGKKFKDADLTGIPFQLIVSEKNQKENLLELKIRSCLLYTSDAADE